ncbi:MAG: bifunctional adenosylcobinamide kinase/adenosylcobinamide-phosphate guanylyltransferase [Nitrospirota bacterium]|nr:bifunctional adenosylcobinamide kinase/adenosylcobinamide-phosphate guanylyltransferase [Nitrospirota bacterium]
MGRSILILGGVRSGKSSLALRLAGDGAKKAFVATAEPFDEEMHRRIRRHKLERQDAFLTMEAPENPGGAVASLSEGIETLVIDCIGVWLGNLFAKRGLEAKNAPEIEGFLSALRAFGGNTLVVSQEATMGLVGMDPLTRAYQETLGLVNQRLAALAETAVLMVAGLPICLKGRL